MFKFINLILFVFFDMLVMVACRDDEHVKVSGFKFDKPLNDCVGLLVSKDTLHLQLNKNTNNQIQSFNTFSDRSVDYIAIYNEPTETVNIYELYPQKLVKSVSIAGYLKYRKHITSVFCKNFDSIFINNNRTSLF